jgi:hypothetical protein
MAYGNDEQRRHAEKDAPKEVLLGCAVLCRIICDADH